MKEVFGYIRVSTARQGEKGVSLIEQKKAIERYAIQQKFTISKWYEERETAAKQGRTVFKEMINALKQGKAKGLVAHKIDRSARNLRDWADLVDLSDQGIEVRFSNESIDLQVRGGRLSADIQAVVAADYIRNLREEAIKGMRGRLEQGFYPWRAPVGYLDKGGGKAKEIDPVKGPIIKELFEKYAGGEYPLKSLLTYAHSRGLTNIWDRPISLNGLSKVLNNPFYTGVISIKRTGESFAGQYKPIITQELFQNVQDVLSGKRVRRVQRHEYLFRRMFHCATCKRTMIGEMQKGHIYYRCHVCKGQCINETQIDVVVRELLNAFELNEEEINDVDAVIQHAKSTYSVMIHDEQEGLQFRHEVLESRLDKLTNGWLDGVVEEELYLAKKNQLVTEINVMKQNLDNDISGLNQKKQNLLKSLELFKKAYAAYPIADTLKKRELLVEISSNRIIDRKDVVIELLSPFQELFCVKNSEACEACRGGTRTRVKGTDNKTFRDRLLEYADEFMKGECSG